MKRKKMKEQGIRTVTQRFLRISAGLICPLYGLLFFLCLFCGSKTIAQRPIPATVQTKSVLISGATIHVGNGVVIQHGDLGFKDGKITLVSTKKETVAFDTVIDASGKHIYPGFILPNTTLGLNEVDAVRATHDYTETGLINPSVRALIGFNTDSKIIPTVRTNGILYCQPTPRGGLISGTSSVMKMDGWNWEDAVEKVDDGIWLNWPTERYRTGWWVEPGEDETNKKRKEELEGLTQLLLRARVFNNENVDLSLAALKGLFDGSKNLYVNVSRAKEIKEAVLFFKDLGIKKIVVCGGEESHLVAGFLKENEVPVLLNRLHSLPYKNDDAYDLTYELPKLLQDAGVVFGLSYTGGMENMGSRNLPFLAGTAVRLGLTKEQALQSITLNTAKILGVDKTCGSLEIGKNATLFISTGDALDMMTNNVELAFIDGRMISLENHQKVLWEQYKGKYGIKN